MRTQVQSLALLNGLRIQCCHDLWCRLQTQLKSHITVAVAQGQQLQLQFNHREGRSGVGAKKTKDKKF